MADQVSYVQVVEKSNGKYVYEARGGDHKAVETSQEYGRASTAAQAGADAYPARVDDDGSMHLTPVRHQVVNGGDAESGDG